MIDFDKEEFLARLDIRICAISAMICEHEKTLCCYNLPREELEKVAKDIDTSNKIAIQWIAKNDKKIQEHFAKLKSDIAKENCENE